MDDMSTQMGNSSSFSLFIRRESALLWSNQENIVQPLFFFLITVSLFPFSLGNDPDLLKLIMPSISWVAIVLAIMMSLSSLFRGDYEDGSLEQWLIGNRSLSLITLAKVLVYWLFNGVFLSIFACIVCLASNIAIEHIKVLFISLLLGTINCKLIVPNNNEINNTLMCSIAILLARQTRQARILRKTPLNNQ